MEHNRHLGTGAAALMLAAVLADPLRQYTPGPPSWVKPPPKEPDPWSPEEIAKGRERRAQAEAKRDKREARRQADKERTLRQQGKL